MPANKKHHYVPKFYLKRFSSNQKSICLWNITNTLKIDSANLKSQCYKNYFYGKDLKIESALSRLEADTAHTLNLVEKYGYPPRVGTEKYLTLVLYILIQYGRTAYSADTFNEMNDKLMKYMIRPRAEAEGIDLDELTIGIEDPVQYSLGVITQFYPLLLDLQCKLLINTTDIQFVVSDNPVVLYNQLFSFRKFGSNCGLASKGLQIFFPISPKSTLVFFDYETYSVGRRNYTAVEVSRPKDVFELNKLQICSAYENIYFQDNQFDVKALHRKASHFRRKQKSNFSVFSVSETKSGKSEIIASSREDIRTNLNLSFIQLTKATKRWRNNFRKQPMEPSMVIRNEALFKDHEDFMTKVDKNQYKSEDFWLYIKNKNEQNE